MFCSECGNKVELDYSIKFCENCGAKVEWPSSSNEKENSFSAAAIHSNFKEEKVDGADSLNHKTINSKKEADYKESLTNFKDFTGVLQIYNDNHFIPSYQISTSGMKNDTMKLTPFKSHNSMGDSFSWLALKIENRSLGKRKIRISIVENEFMKNSEQEFEVKQKGELFLLPEIAWKYKLLKQNKQLSPFMLQVKVTSYDFTGKPEEHFLQETCQMVSINFCPFYVKREEKFMGSLFAAYVNEDHPDTEEIRKEALSLGIINSFYGGNNFTEIEAIWKALTNRGIQYSNVTTTSFSQTYKDVYGQFVRLTGDVLKSDQANCVDGSVFIASILQKIDFGVSLVLVPGHMFICVDDIIGMGEIYIETTRLGEKGELSEALIDTNKEMTEHLNNYFLNYSYQTIFSENSVEELINLNPDLDEETARDFISRFKKISIQEAREQNITPIGANEKLLN